MVREVAARVLRGQGYTVLEATNGHEALGVAGKHAGGGIHLLFTDVVMPLMSVEELVERQQGMHPEAKVLYTSSYNRDRFANPGRSATFMRKPFTSGELARNVRKALGD